MEQSIRRYIDSFTISDYKASIIIDGLSKRVSERIGVALRKAGISVRKIRGERDESSAIIRLADALAGVIRESKEGNIQYEKFEKKLKKKKILIEI